MALSARQSERLRERYADKENAVAGPSDNIGKRRTAPRANQFVGKHQVQPILCPGKHATRR